MENGDDRILGVGRNDIMGSCGFFLLLSKIYFVVLYLRFLDFTGILDYSCTSPLVLGY